jgi:hypothetical protein
MLQTTISIPEMLSQAGDDARVYPWFAFFWADVNSLATPQPVTVYVEPGFSRDNYPNAVQPGLPVWIPPVGTHTVDLDDGGNGTAMAGVLVVLFRQHETPDDAIAAGYAAFPGAVSTQLNDFVAQNPFTQPTDDQVKAMADAIDAAVTSAVRSALSWYDLLLPQDETIGNTHAVFFGGSDQADPITTLGRRDLQLPVAGSFSFPAAAIDVEIPVPDPCTAQEAALRDAMSGLQQVNADIASLKHVIATGTLAEKAEARQELAEIRSNELPAAKQAVAAAQAALARCRQTGPSGNGSCSGVTRMGSGERVGATS